MDVLLDVQKIPSPECPDLFSAFGSPAIPMSFGTRGFARLVTFEACLYRVEISTNLRCLYITQYKYLTGDLTIYPNIFHFC